MKMICDEKNIVVMVEKNKFAAKTNQQHKDISLFSMPANSDNISHDYDKTFPQKSTALSADLPVNETGVRLIYTEEKFKKKNISPKAEFLEKLDKLPDPSVNQVQIMAGDPSDRQEIAPIASLFPAVAKTEDVNKLKNNAELSSLTSGNEPLLFESSLYRPSGQPSLAPSPMFKTGSSSKSVSSGPEENFLGTQSLNEIEDFSEQSSETTYGPKNLDSSNFKQNCSSDPHAISNVTGSPVVVSQIPLCLKSTSSQVISKHQTLHHGSNTQAVDSKVCTQKRVDNCNSRSPSKLSSSIHVQFPSMSIPTYLQLELSTKKSPLYIPRASSNESPFESTKIKLQRLKNFLILPPQLEQLLLFGSLACLDAWLHTFTILPLRFLKAAGILVRCLGHKLTREIKFITGFIYHGSGRIWHRRRERPNPPKIESLGKRERDLILPKIPAQADQNLKVKDLRRPTGNLLGLREDQSRLERGRRHYKKSHRPSLSSQNKADLIRGILIISSCVILMKLDASRMYHYIRGQAAIKLYVIFNVLEVGDKLLAALGQDIFECLFSNEMLRQRRYRDWLFQPFWIFLMALVYNVCHAAALFFQVITLNVAVNSYSNALFTLLMSNQFVEIKSTVFKKIEKDNLFQLTCADVVERFQLCIILIIIALRNLVEMGSLTMPSGGINGEGIKLKDATSNIYILPNSFSLLSNWSGEILSPFFFVLGSEMLVDWIKHSYISKFNNVKPTIYGRYLDILAKDYYTNAFINQNLVKRFGLPVMPLACLFIRSSVQTYHMFLATYLRPPNPSSAMQFAVETATSSPATTAALEHFDTIIRHALGRSTYGIQDPSASNTWYIPNTDNIIAALTMMIFFLAAFFVLLAFKLVLGLLLLKFSHRRYQRMKLREQSNSSNNTSYDINGKRIGIWGMTEVDDDKKRYIYKDDPISLNKIEEKQRDVKDKSTTTSQDYFLHKIGRYDMLKRIW
ncbi:Endoplasmic reticulum membrane protein 65 [Erysiphe neolycopersici]|uniref:Endoplasmic reticulum membrane protein 65 n=1 Tax=Erysiphe neolycopersici TaxID=212602 RepID=A0A420H8C3_9PEZI|nr:Endoplasmic reticulum membrane protein 65 [Erysiphe neolycopersici]